MQWRTVFWIAFGVFVITNIIYVIFGSGEEQWWNMHELPITTTATTNSSESSFSRDDNESSEKQV